VAVKFPPFDADLAIALRTSATWDLLGPARGPFVDDLGGTTPSRRRGRVVPKSILAGAGGERRAEFFPKGTTPSNRRGGYIRDGKNAPSSDFDVSRGLQARAWGRARYTVRCSRRTKAAWCAEEDIVQGQRCWPLSRQRRRQFARLEERTCVQFTALWRLAPSARTTVMSRLTPVFPGPPI
jgi:hypothetical protein